jgi:prepilin-type N-terminal cleavage/methylation domain-containing protein
VIAMRHHNDRPCGPRAFTLIELLITMSIIAIMASMVLVGLYSAQEAGKTAKTKALIARLDSIIKTRYESYRTRRVPVASGANRTATALARLGGLRDMMRMELPDRWSDIVAVAGTNPPYMVGPNLAGLQSQMTPGGPTLAGIPTSSVWRGYVRRVTAGPAPTLDYQGAECLYLIVMSALAEEGDAREVFKPGDVGDVDGDGFPEFLDAWGQPIRFLRWAPGFQYSELQVVAHATAVSGGGPNKVTISDPGLSSTPGAYVGGTIIATNAPSSGALSSPYAFDPTQAARITDYQPGMVGQGTITFTSTGSPAFSNVWVLIMAPDPFDPFGTTATTAIPSFALYPLIYSAGPDKAYSIISDAGGAVLSYPAAVPNPFQTVVTTSGITVMVGDAVPIGSDPSNGWADNIHNHMLGTR